MLPAADVSSGMAVKREPPERSPNHFTLYWTQSQSPTPSPMYAYQNNVYTPNISFPSTNIYSPSSPQQQVSPRNHMSPHQEMNIVGVDIGLPRPSPGLQAVVIADYDVPNVQNVATLVSPRNAGAITNGDVSYLDMDTSLCNSGASLNRLDSKDLAELELLDAGNLSQNLSANLTLSETKQQKQVQMNESMTDSFSRLATSAINEICSYDIYDASSAH